MSRPSKQIVLRDDDLNFFTDPVLLEKAYGLLFERQIPIKFSTNLVEQRAEYDSGCFPNFDSSHRQSN